jgi:signal transduction histidine kinase
LNKQLQYINDSSGLSAVLNNEATDVVGQLSLETATAMYRVLEELLNNTIKHAAATEITINILAQQNQLLITYRDNGKGLPADNAAFINGIGMRNIESRLSLIGAHYQLGAPGKKGFEINIEYPLPQTEPAHA